MPQGTVTSVISVQFREKKSPEEALASWAFWHSRQPSSATRIIDVDTVGSMGLKGAPVEMAFNAVAITWAPSQGPAVLSVAVRCLSTDFSSQKGVKGIPLHIQVKSSLNLFGQEFFL